MRLINPKALDAALAALDARPAEALAGLAGAVGDAPASRRELSDLVASVQDAQTTVIRHVATNTEAALDAIEDRLAALEGRKGLCWAGAHDISRVYAAGDLVQRGGALWLALTAVTAGDGPGASPAWRRLAESKS